MTLRVTELEFGKSRFVRNLEWGLAGVSPELAERMAVVRQAFGTATNL